MINFREKEVVQLNASISLGNIPSGQTFYGRIDLNSAIIPLLHIKTVCSQGHILFNLISPFPLFQTSQL